MPFLFRYSFPFLIETNYVSDGFHPETGDANTSFVFRISYTDPDNDLPKSDYPKVSIKKNGTDISGSPFKMSEVDSNDTDCTDGKIYQYSSTLEPGAYTYCFSAYDIYDTKATGSPTSENSGPTIISKPPEAKKAKIYHGVFKPGENEKTYISFNVSDVGETTIKVYDSLGREINELYRGTASIGLNTITWDGKDSDGNSVSSGVYIIRIEGPQISQQKKVVVIR